MCDDERRPLSAVDHVRDRVRLPGPGDTQKDLVFDPGLDITYKFPDRRRLVAGRRVRGIQLELHQEILALSGEAYKSRVFVLFFRRTDHRFFAAAHESPRFRQHLFRKTLGFDQRPEFVDDRVVTYDLEDPQQSEFDVTFIAE